MAFRVEVAPQAFDDLNAMLEHIKVQGNLETAEKWFRSVMRSIRSLEEMPGRCPIAEESAELGQEVRLLLHGRKNRAYKIILGFNTKRPRAVRFESFISAIGPAEP